MSTGHVATVHRYHDIWAEPDGAVRLATLADIWSEDGLYVDPDLPQGVRGREALSDMIGTALLDLPGLSIVALTDLAVLGDRAWYRWQETKDAGPTIDGVDFIEFAPDGKIARLTGFW